ncbi:DUF4123 domain-containing protein [Pseudomonas sp. IAC-BECa141]|uniref:DUF4123 domain-containing protein n=1 Tax=Pseudomonas sp. IAC-BECa141 TaxID=2793103 RepID=UPI001D08778B|nr:DUF4123 domain-containing protein [Pseudomonas sp. IAC-BECa141]UDI93467.1 DUF4123 domain-containing protein [Pseudomonas sp. IAC-BECa141]
MNRAYLLLDQIQIENLPERLFELTGGVMPHSLYQRTAYSALDKAGPVLVAVTPDSPLAQVFSQEWSTTAGLWLESQADEGALLEHLRSLIHARVEGDVTVLFRFYDPRITALWLADKPAAERDRLMGPVHLIRLPGLQIRQLTEQPAIPYADRPWLVLTAEQLNDLNAAKRRTFAGQLIEHALRYFPKCLGSQEPTALQQWAMDCQGSAARNGFSAVEEVLLWARFYAVLGADFPDGPAHGAYRQLLAEPGVLPRQRLDNLNGALTHQLLTDKDLTL